MQPLNLEKPEAANLISSSFSSSLDVLKNLRNLEQKFCETSKKNGLHPRLAARIENYKQVGPMQLKVREGIKLQGNLN